jgi:hypothetical protein
MRKAVESISSLSLIPDRGAADAALPVAQIPERLGVDEVILRREGVSDLARIEQGDPGPRNAVDVIGKTTELQVRH